jgi:putative phosphonate metabolism protein
MTFTRYALYYAPPPDAPWAQYATSWLGWDMQARQSVAQLQLDLPLPIAEISKSPRKYGLHATLKPPFRLATGVTRADLESACAELCANLPPLQLENLRLTRMGRFLALCPAEKSPELSALAGNCVRGLDSFRAPFSSDELADRRAAQLSPRQMTNLDTWGYPYVLEDFRFHITLTGRLAKPDLNAVHAVLDRTLTPLLPRRQSITDLALVGEDSEGRFHLLRRFELSG